MMMPKNALIRGIVLSFGYRLHHCGVRNGMYIVRPPVWPVYVYAGARSRGFLWLTEAEPLAHLLKTIACLFLRSLAEQLHQSGILARRGDLIGEIVIFCG